MNAPSQKCLIFIRLDRRIAPALAPPLNSFSARGKGDQSFSAFAPFAPSPKQLWRIGDRVWGKQRAEMIDRNSNSLLIGICRYLSALRVLSKLFQAGLKRVASRLPTSELAQIVKSTLNPFFNFSNFLS